MTRDELDQQYTAIIRKWARTIADRDGVPPLGLLNELTAVADAHAVDAARAYAEQPVENPPPIRRERAGRPKAGSNP